MTETHSDPLDLGADLAQRERDAGLAAVRANIKPIVQSPVCLHCGEYTQNGNRWCNFDCMTDYTKEQGRK